MTDLSKATPRPWHIQPMYGPSGDVLFYAIVADGSDQWNAVASTFNRDGKSLEAHQADVALILQAVNERDELIAALRNAKEELAYQVHKGHRVYSCSRTASLPGRCDCGLDEFKAAVARIDIALAAMSRPP